MAVAVDTRRIEELKAKIELANQQMEAEDELGCGFTPASYFDEMNEIIGKMQEELAELKGYSSYEEMVEAEYEEDEDLPF